jgi:hypothetical protein
MTRLSSGSRSSAASRIGRNGARVPAASTPEIAASSGSILSPSIATTVWPSFMR